MEKEKSLFNFKISRKYEAWEEMHYQLEADNYEEAEKRILQKFDNEEDIKLDFVQDNDGVYYNDKNINYLYPKDGELDYTRELIGPDNKIIKTNMP